MSVVGNFSRHKHFDELDLPLQTGSGWLTPAQRRALCVANLGLASDLINLSNAEIAILEGQAAGTGGVVIVPDATPYAVLAANSGKLHVIAEQAANITINLPVIATGLDYEFIGSGVAAEAQNWIFVATTPSFYNGGVLWGDLNGGPAADELGTVFGNGSSHLTFTAVTPSAGTYIRIVSIGAEWSIHGNVISDSTPTMA